jgi:ribosome-associated toxin RatA of RatAB toxin-antitoxin module
LTGRRSLRPGEGCEIDFVVDLEFRLRLLQEIIGTLFHEAVCHLIAASERRSSVFE